MEVHRYNKILQGECNLPDLFCEASASYVHHKRQTNTRSITKLHFSANENDIDWSTLPSPSLSTFEEIYFDNQQTSLLPNNIWLRTRGEEWSLKTCIEVSNNSLFYKETNDKQEIMDYLANFLGKKDDAKEPNNYCPLHVARFHCTRLTYNISSSTKLYFDCIQLSPFNFYFLGTIDSDCTQSFDNLLPNFKATAVNSKIVEYLRMNQPHLLPSSVVLQPSSPNAHLSLNPLIAHGAVLPPKPRLTTSVVRIYIEDEESNPFAEVDEDDDNYYYDD
eukprot:TRINITY_DN6230_c0_g1_i1.p1 TRINITY_DN6230_c0_g1~~TRINITY_DN6230_c0_g1_i1.p1  ORF type:complete len:276 (+),score=39.09 TRINITY_DN6230_c0_g1_i1:244-1071(+)